MTSLRSLIIEFIEHGAIPADKIEAALTSAKVRPDTKSWRIFIDHVLLWLGGLALAFAIMFFIAYNWKDLGGFAKFGMVEGFIVLAIVAYLKFAENTMASKVSLLVATIALGVLLALYGQTYQTGADPWQLFFNWALLMLPWAVISRFSALWIIWIALLNTSLLLYYQTFRGIFGLIAYDDSGMLWLAFLINTSAFIVWQILAATWHWLSDRWAIRLLAIGSGLPLTWLAMRAIFDHPNTNALPGIVWTLWLVAMYCMYRRVRLDLFMLAGCCLSAILVTVSLLSEHLLKYGEAGTFLFLAFIVVSMGGGAAFWLKNIHQECQQ